MGVPGERGISWAPRVEANRRKKKAGTSEAERDISEQSWIDLRAKHLPECWVEKIGELECGDKERRESARAKQRRGAVEMDRAPPA